MRLVLTRESEQRSDCTLGFLDVADLKLCTIERPWIEGIGKGGAKGISCVPKGLYQLVKHDSEAHPETWALVNEALDVIHWPDSARPHARTAVLIHSANTVAEIRGCLAPGTRAGKTERGEHAVFNSRQAMSLIRQRVPWTDEHFLEIR